MKITDKQIMEMVREEIRSAVSEMKYKKMYSIVKKCVNEAFEDPRFNFMADDDDKDYDNDCSWDELMADDKKNKKMLGSNAEDIFNGKYDSETDDYFEDSDFRFTNDYWKDKNPIASSDIQKARLRDAFNNTVESVCKRLKKELMNEGTIDTMVNTHYAVLKPINKIVFSWDYTGYDPQELKDDKDTYFKDDIVDMGFRPKDIKILTRKACVRMGLDPTEDANWDNGYDYMVESKKNGKKMNEGTISGAEETPEKQDDEYEVTEAIDFYDFERICSENGWEWHAHMGVSNGKAEGTRYVFGKGKGCTFDELVAKLKQAARNENGIIPGTAVNRQAPEIKYYTIIVLDEVPEA